MMENTPVGPWKRLAAKYYASVSVNCRSRYLLLLLLLFAAGEGRGQTVTLSTPQPLAVPNASICRNASGVEAYAFTLSSNATTTLTEIDFSSTALSGDVLRYKLFMKSTPDVQLATCLPSSLSFTGLTVPLSSAAATDFYITADIGNVTTAGHNFTISALVPSQIIINSGSVSLSSTPSPADGGIQAIAIPPAPISAAGAVVCSPSTLSLSEIVTGGTWQSNNTAIATVDNLGVVSFGGTPGAADITYQLTNACGSNTVHYAVSADNQPSVAAISGLSAVCVSSAITLSESSIGGSWSIISGVSNITLTSDGVSSDTVAIGMNAGSSVISYKIVSQYGCADSMIKTITIRPLPNTNILNYSICKNDSLIIPHSPGGTNPSWTTSDQTIASVNQLTGHLYAVNPGNVTITYSDTTIYGCVSTSYAYDTVKAIPDTIVGPSYVCEHNSALFSNTVAGGSWATSNDSFLVADPANINNQSVLITGVSGNTTEALSVKYSVNGCSVSKPVVIYTKPKLIDSFFTVCSGSGTPIVLNTTILSSYSWTSFDTVHISGNHDSSAGAAYNVIRDTLLNNDLVTDNIRYSVIAVSRLSGCIDTQNIYVAVNPAPDFGYPDTVSLCSGDICKIKLQPTLFGTRFGAQIANTVFGITAAGMFITQDTVQQVLQNSNASTIGYLTYIITDTSNLGCRGLSHNVVAAINPLPVFNDTSIWICSNQRSSLILNASVHSLFSWHMPSALDISQATSDTNAIKISDSLVSATPFATRYINYHVIPISDSGCVGHAGTVSIGVNPLPRITVNTFYTCSGSSNIILLKDTATDGSASFYTWHFIDSLSTEVGNPGSDTTNQNGILQSLIDTDPSHTTEGIAVYTVAVTSDSGCTSFPETVNVVVYPTPILRIASKSVCSQDDLVFSPGFSVASNIQWNVNTNPSHCLISQTQGFSDTLFTNISSNYLNVVSQVSFRYSMTSLKGCNNTEDAIITVNPRPKQPSIISANELRPCIGSQYQQFNLLGDSTSYPHFNNINYEWTTSNISDSIFQQTGNNSSNSLITFNAAGVDIIKLTANYTTVHCYTSDSLTKYVSDTAIDVTPAADIIYDHNDLICLKNNVKVANLSNNIYSYQWGYDNAADQVEVTKKDSIYQSYYEPDLDTAAHHWWVKITDSVGCPQKSYYNGPLAHNKGIAPVAAIKSLTMNVYPNPATNELTIEMNDHSVSGLFVELYDITGKKVGTQLMDGYIARMQVNQLQPGNYLVVCRQNGIKVATTQFIKN